MKNKKESIEEKLKSTMRNIEYHTTGLDNCIKGLYWGVLMLPTIFAEKFGYDMQNIDTLYESVALLSAGIGASMSIYYTFWRNLKLAIEFDRKKKEEK